MKFRTHRDHHQNKNFTQKSIGSDIKLEQKSPHIYLYFIPENSLCLKSLILRYEQLHLTFESFLKL
jgi:hypothetical protein